MLRRLLVTPAVLLALGSVATPASAEYRVLCVEVKERVGEALGFSIVIQGPVPLPPYPNKACVPMLVDPPVDLPPIVVPPGG